MLARCLLREPEAWVSPTPDAGLAVKKHHDHGNAYKGKRLTGACFIVIKTGSTVAHRQTKPWRRSWEFYIQVSRQWEERDSGPGLDF